MSESGLTVRDITEMEARAKGHTEGRIFMAANTIDGAIDLTTEGRYDRVPVAAVSVGYSEPFDREQRANAAQLTLAWNSFDAMKAALERVEQEFTPGHDQMAPNHVIRVVRAALALARGLNPTTTAPVEMPGCAPPTIIDREA